MRSSFSALVEELVSPIPPPAPVIILFRSLPEFPGIIANIIYSYFSGLGFVLAVCRIDQGGVFG